MSEIFNFQYIDGTSTTWIDTDNVFNGDTTSFAYIDAPLDVEEDDTEYIMTTANNVDATSLINIDTTGYEITFLAVKVRHKEAEDNTAIWIQPHVYGEPGGHYQCTNTPDRNVSSFEILKDRAGPYPFWWSVSDLENLQFKIYPGSTTDSGASQVNVYDISLQMISGDATSVTPIDSTSAVDTTGMYSFITDYFDSTALNTSIWTESYQGDGSSLVVITDSTTGNGNLVIKSGTGSIGGIPFTPTGVYQEIYGDFDITCKIAGFTDYDATVKNWDVGVQFELDDVTATPIFVWWKCIQAHTAAVANYPTQPGGAAYWTSTTYSFPNREAGMLFWINNKNYIAIKTGGFGTTLSYTIKYEEPIGIGHSTSGAYYNTWMDIHRIRYFRMIRWGDTYQIYHSRDDQVWVPMLDVFTFPHYKFNDGNFWLFTEGDGVPDYWAWFDYVKNNYTD